MAMVWLPPGVLVQPCWRASEPAAWFLHLHLPQHNFSGYKRTAWGPLPMTAWQGRHTLHEMLITRRYLLHAPPAHINCNTPLTFPHITCCRTDRGIHGSCHQPQHLPLTAAAAPAAAPAAATPATPRASSPSPRSPAHMGSDCASMRRGVPRFMDAAAAARPSHCCGARAACADRA